MSKNLGRTFAIGISPNLGLVLAEAFYGWQSGSLALLADAGHNLSDVGGLLLSWAGLAVGRLDANNRHTYGWRRGSIMASFASAVVLLLAMGSLSWEAVQRLHTPAPFEGTTVMVVAGISVAIKGMMAALFVADREKDLNIRSAFLHMLAGALTSTGVVFASALYLRWGWGWVDPVASIAIAIVIVAGTWSVLRQSLHLLFDGVPDQIDLLAVRQSLLALPGVQNLHDLHIWALSTHEVALTVHLVMPNNHPDEAFLRTLDEMLRTRFRITHPTIQIEENPIEHIGSI